MNVAFKRTGARRYAVIVTRAGESPQAMDPAPGYDDDIPHDLVHYRVEAVLALANGVYATAVARAARGPGARLRVAGATAEAARRRVGLVTLRVTFSGRVSPSHR
jgi:hypothetical protein